MGTFIHMKLGLDQNPPKQKWTSVSLQQSPHRLELHLLLSELNFTLGELKIIGS